MDQWKCIAKTGASQTRFSEIPKYAEGLYDLNNQLYAWMVPNGSWGESNAGLIVGDGESLLVDTLWDVKFSRVMLEAMEALTLDAPIKTLVNTHADGDHFFGNQLLPDVETITSQSAYDEMGHTQPKSMLLLGRVGKLMSSLRLFGMDKAGHWFQGMVKPYDFQEVIHTLPTRTFNGEMTLDIGGRKVELIEVGPAHTDGDLLVHVPDAKTIFTADILFIGSTPVMWAGPVENWIAALDRILEMDVETIVPGHGPITNKAGVQQVKAYWEYTSTQLRQCFDAGMSAQAAAHKTVLAAEYAQQPFGNWNSPERMMTNAHTLYRQWRGETKPPSIPTLINTLRKQALLAHELPQAQPIVMRKG